MTYARARLWTGVLGVGSFVLLATVFLVADTATSILANRGGTPWSDAALLAAVLGAMALFALPLDIAGGFLLPRKHGRPHPTATGFALAWLRGVAVLVAIPSLIGAGMLAAGRSAGLPGALAVFALASLVLVVLQEPIARLVGGMRRAGRKDKTIVLRTSDPAFSGGFQGLSGTMVIPEPWFRHFEPRLLLLLIRRRQRIHSCGARMQALAMAMAWNLAGFTLASLIPQAGVTSVAEIVNTSLGFTLWTFMGLLVLPTPSRRATFAMDALAAADGGGDRLDEAIRVLDALQDDEPERSAGVETIFHPVPSVASRVRALAKANTQRCTPWNLARTTLYLAHAGMTPLPRAVHCNVGRPELWVYLPADG